MKASNRRNRTHEYACQLGYTLTRCGSGHYKAVHPKGMQVITLSSSTKEINGKREMSRLRKNLKEAP